MNLNNLQIRRCLAKAKDDSSILAVLLFGSQLRKKTARPDSDIDLCLIMQPAHYSALTLSKKKISYLELGGALDIQIFQKLPLPMKQRILHEGKVLHCKDVDSFYREAYQVMRQFSRFSRIYESYLASVLHGR